ncbi:hypocretin neuropeptide precursor [Parambassis ranga]|uniref:Hypocretin neuropeptide precursor n=1 Tax=Parambassis ranga TaxID=210632 RepID=A0A6P7IRQ8_9TELE|nr:orexin [Parambassis ranga]
MTFLHISQKMTWFPHNFKKAAGMDSSNRKVLVLVLMLLLSQLACDAHSVSECCRQPSRSCRLYVLLCRPGSKGLGGTLTGDAAAGILTLGKRGGEEHRLQTRLQQLLHGSRNQAAGILTMGKRTEERAGEQYMDWLIQSGTTMVTPLPA